MSGITVEWLRTKRGVYLISKTKDRWDSMELTNDERTMVMNGLAKVVPQITLQPYSTTLGNYKHEMLKDIKFMDIIDKLKTSEVFDTVNWKSFAGERREGKTKHIIALNTLKLEEGNSQTPASVEELPRRFKRKFLKKHSTTTATEGSQQADQAQTPGSSANQSSAKTAESPGYGRGRGYRGRGRGRGTPDSVNSSAPGQQQQQQQQALPSSSGGNGQQGQPQRGRGNRGRAWRGKRGGDYRGQRGRGRGNAAPQQSATLNSISTPAPIDLNSLYRHGGYVPMANGSWAMIAPPQYPQPHFQGNGQSVQATVPTQQSYGSVVVGNQQPQQSVPFQPLPSDIQRVGGMSVGRADSPVPSGC